MSASDSQPVRTTSQRNQTGPDRIQVTGEKRINMDSLKSRLIFTLVLPSVLVACTQQQQNPQELKEKTAEATAQVKSDAKAVAEGIREGWNRNSNQPLDLNSATKGQLLSLPGLTSAEADRVIAARPYSDPRELVTRHIIPKTEYDKIADRVTAKR